MAQRPPGRVAPGDSEGTTPPVSETFSAGRPGTGSPTPGSRRTGAPVSVTPPAGCTGVTGGTRGGRGGGGGAAGGGRPPARGGAAPPPGGRRAPPPPPPPP